MFFENNKREDLVDLLEILSEILLEQKLLLNIDKRWGH